MVNGQPEAFSRVLIDKAYEDSGWSLTDPLSNSQLGVEYPTTLEARQLRDTYPYFGCGPGQPTCRYDILDAANDIEGPLLCLSRTCGIRTEITTQALPSAGRPAT